MVIGFRLEHGALPVLWHHSLDASFLLRCLLVDLERYIDSWLLINHGIKGGGVIIQEISGRGALFGLDHQYWARMIYLRSLVTWNKRLVVTSCIVKILTVPEGCDTYLFSIGV